MAVLFSDGFDSYSASADLLFNWSTVPAGWTYSANEGRVGGGAIKCAPGSIVGLTRSGLWNVSGGTLLGYAGWFKFSAAPSAAGIFMYDALGNQGIGVNTSGFPVFYGSGSIYATGNINLCDNGWHWLEVAWPNQNGGTTKCFLDHVQQWNGGYGQSTAARSSVTIQNLASNGTVYVDDFFVFDVNAPAPTPSDMPLGPKYIATIRPSANSSVQFTPDSGDNYARVNEQTADADSSYVEDGTSGHADLYTYDAIDFAPSAITAVQLISRLKNPGAGAINFKNTCSSQSSSSDGASTVTPSSYANHRTIFSQDPATSAAWTKAGLDAAKFGVKVV